MIMLFLRRYMSMMPGESVSPVYTIQDENWDTYVKFLLYGAEKGAASRPGIRIFQ
jgi:hypothetical protein